MRNEFSYSQEGRIACGHIERVMGTRFDMVIPDIAEAAARMIWDSMCEWLQSSDSLLDRFNAESEVARLNAGKADSPSEALSEWIETGEHYRKLTEGLFSVRASGCLDFGGIAKGVAVRHAKTLLQSRGVLNAYIDFGGSAILGLGHHPYGPEWKVSVRDPFRGGVLMEADLRDLALSTSGNTPGYSGHIINPLSGEKCVSRRLVCVTAADPVEAEVLSTTLMIASDGQKDRLADFFPTAKVSIFEL